MQNDSLELLFCPSFNCYSEDKNLVDIAATVSRESAGVLDDEEFEFSNNLLESPVKSSFPIFNRDLLLNGDEEDGRGGDGDDDDEVKEAVRIPLRNLFIGDGDLPSSSSSSSEDELEGLPTETYCVWKPKQSSGSSPNRCKKSKSAGSSSSKRRWNLIKDLLKRSNSDSKVSASSSLLLNFDKGNIEKKLEEKASEKTATTTKKKKKSEGEVTATKSMKVEKVSAHEAFYVRNKALREGDKRRSYLPYRQDLVGIFANVNGLRRTSATF